MGNLLDFPSQPESQIGFERIRATYSVRDISRQFGLSEHHIRRWTREGLIQTAAPDGRSELRYGFRALTQFRRVRALKQGGLSVKQIEAELRGQLNLFPEPEGRLIELPLRFSPFEKALILHEQGNEAAREAYLEAISKGDNKADAYCNLGIIEFESGNFPQAFNCFTRSLEQDPRHFESHFNLAYLYFESGDLRLARLHYEIAAEIEPGFSDLHFSLGLVQAMSGDLAAAVTALEKARELAQADEQSKIDDLLENVREALTE